MKFDLSGKKAVVTGGSNGIGKAIATTLNNQGAEVFIIDLNDNPSHQKLGIQTLIADITQWNQLNSLLTFLPNTIDILINNAGITRDNIMLRMQEDEWDNVIDVHLNGQYLLIKSFIKKMVNGSLIFPQKWPF